MTRLEHVAAAVIIGLPLAWLALLETGWAHHRGQGWTLLGLGLALACCTLAWLWLRFWQPRGDRRS